MNAMRYIFYSIFSSIVGCFAGGIVGLGFGNLYVVVFDVPNFEGTSGYVAVGIAYFGCMIGILAGLAYGAFLAHRKSHGTKSSNQHANETRTENGCSRTHGPRSIT